ncbi:hypothetical protein [Micromonospora sp. NPDC051141]|uniref:hypothetical protein n=1 Tax=Micromonospora sp. NPDC051141 TaxID=3364284 RepID=UPI003789C580
MFLRNRVCVGLLAAAGALAAGLASIATPAMAAPAPAAVGYTAVEGVRTLTFLNAPERLLYGEDTDRDLIYRGSLDPGAHRVFFEHGNYSGTPFVYGILVQNTSGCDLTVKVDRKGYGTYPGAGVGAAAPLATMLNGNGAETAKSLPRNTSAWLFTATAPANAFFTGAIDLNTTRVVSSCVGGAVFVKVGVFSALPTASAAAALPYRGADNGDGLHNDRKVYDGRVTVPYGVNRHANEVVAQNLNYTIDATTALNQNFPVSYGGVTRDRWTTNATPSRKPAAIGNDMLSVWMPLSSSSFTLTEINPFELDPRNSDGTTGNLANWGVVETNTGRITNNTGVSHTVRYVLRQGDTGGNVRFAHRCSVNGAAAAWTSVDMPAGAPAKTKECVITVPAFGSATFSVSQVLGGPSIGVLENYLVMTA